MKFLKKIKKNTTKNNKVEIGTLYDINKNLIEKNVKDLTIEEINNKKELFEEYIEKTQNEYYMLLCNDRKDYTIFRRTGIGSEDSIGCCLIDILLNECLPNRGNTKSIELTENKDAIEIWISIDGESYCYYFFPYDTAIIEC